MKIPFIGDNKYKKLKNKLENIISQYEEFSKKKDDPFSERYAWVAADIQDAINETENENA